MDQETQVPSMEAVYQEMIQNAQGRQPGEPDVYASHPLSGMFIMPSRDEIIGTLIFDALTRGLGKIPALQRTLSTPLKQSAEDILSKMNFTRPWVGVKPASAPGGTVPLNVPTSYTNPGPAVPLNAAQDTATMLKRLIEQLGGGYAGIGG